MKHITGNWSLSDLSAIQIHLGIVVRGEKEQRMSRKIGKLELPTKQNMAIPHPVFNASARFGIQLTMKYIQTRQVQKFSRRDPLSQKAVLPFRSDSLRQSTHLRIFHKNASFPEPLSELPSQNLSRQYHRTANFQIPLFFFRFPGINCRILSCNSFHLLYSEMRRLIQNTSPHTEKTA